MGNLGDLLGKQSWNQQFRENYACFRFLGKVLGYVGAILGNSGVIFRYFMLYYDIVRYYYVLLFKKCKKRQICKTKKNVSREFYDFVFVPYVLACFPLVCVFVGIVAIGVSLGSL